MNVIKTEKQIKEVDVVIEDYDVCDKCNCLIEKEDFDLFKCSIIYKTGYCYREGGYIEEKEVQLCKKCADDLFEFLKSNNYRIVKSERDI